MIHLLKEQSAVLSVEADISSITEKNEYSKSSAESSAG
jgi:hypothetical protein